MNSLEVGKQYLIRSKKISGATNQPYTDEWLVEVISFCDRNPDRIYVKYLSGDDSIKDKERTISYKSYYFEEYQDIEYLKKINREIDLMYKEVKSKIEDYKQLEKEVLFLRGAILVIIYMYIMGYIRFV
jgi:hypothetical protein